MANECSTLKSEYPEFGIDNGAFSGFDRAAFERDALLQNLIVGMLGYWTENGLTSPDDDQFNPPRFRQK